MKKENKNIGTRFEDYLKEQGIFEEVSAAAIKEIIAEHLSSFMKKENITQTEMAERLQTSRTGLQRLLDPKNTSITLLTLNKVARVLGKRIEINIK